MLIKIKNIIAHVLYYTGVIPLLEKTLLKDRCVVLVYHRIVNPEEEIIPVQDGMYVTPDVFEMHLHYLKKQYNLISVEEVITNLKNRESFNNNCHITFDDGWKDNYINAFPLLKKYKIPATVFLSSDFIGTTKWFWPEKVLYLLMKAKRQESKIDVNIETKEVLRLFYQALVYQEERINAVVDFLKNKPIETIESVIADLKKLTGINTLPHRRQLLDWKEVLEMVESSITLGSHTETHAILTHPDNEDEIRREIAGSKDKIEAKTGKLVKSFCFPNGSSTTELMEMVKKYGYECAFGGEKGTLGHRDNLYNLKRVGIHNDVASNIPMFACRIIFNFF